MANQTVFEKYSSTGMRRFVALREAHGKIPGGSPVGPCVWYDMHANRSYPAGENWEKPPPDLPSGDVGKEPRAKPPGQAYRDNYQKIFGHV